MKGLLIFLLVVGGLLYAGNQGFQWYQDQVYSPAGSKAQTVPFKVTPGETGNQVGDDLAAKGLIRSREAFQAYLKISGATPNFQAGDYVLNKGMNIPQLIDALGHAVADQFTFTIPEGYTLDRTASKWQAEGHGSAADYVAAANPANWLTYDFVAARPKVAARKDNLEGYLYPDTYSLNKGATAKDLVKAQLDQFQKVFTPTLREKAKALNQTVDSIVILASMVDREVQTNPNRAIVCGIYYNRFDIHNALDVDATILYALGRTTGAQTVTDQDKRDAANSPYDTYTHPGPPPGPISNPGADAINGCITPAQRDQKYIFYFAACDGATHFAKNEVEFENQMAKFGVVGGRC